MDKRHCTVMIQLYTTIFERQNNIALLTRIIIEIRNLTHCL